MLLNQLVRSCNVQRGPRYSMVRVPHTVSVYSDSPSESCGELPTSVTGSIIRGEYAADTLDLSQFSFVLGTRDSTFRD